VLEDCCGFCPEPETDEDLAAAEEESKIYISGKVNFLVDDPGRQAIGSFHPLTDDDWTEMAYVGNTQRLCQAIVEKDLEGVKDWFQSGELEQVDVNRRDHAGRTPLQLATMCSTPEIAQVLIDRGARIVSRIYNGMTALHIAAYHGEADMVSALLSRSAENEEFEDLKDAARKAARRELAKGTNPAEKVANDDAEIDDDLDELDDEDSEEDSDDVTEGSFIKVKDQGNVAEDNEDEPDVYDVDVLAWDNPMSPLHFAIIGGHVEVIELLVDEYGADVLLPVKILSSHDRTPESAILTLVLALNLPLAEAKAAINALMLVGATTSQADMKQVSALHYAVNEANVSILEAMKKMTDSMSLKKNINALSTERTRYGWYDKSVNTPLLTAVRSRNAKAVNAVLEMGAQPEISLDEYSVLYHREERHASEDPEQVKKIYQQNVDQPVVIAAQLDMPDTVGRLLDEGASPNSCPKSAYQFLGGHHWRQENKSLLDLVDDRVKALKESLEGKPTALKESIGGMSTVEKLSAPGKLASDDTYLDYPRGSYQSWFAAHELVNAKYVQDYLTKSYNTERKDAKTEPQQGEKERKDALKALFEKYVALATKLRKAGAKTFRGTFTTSLSYVYAVSCWLTSSDLFPDAPEKAENDRYGYGHNRYRPSGKNHPYKTEFNFYHANVTDKNRADYVKLFEAAWEGDQSAVKEVCLRKESPLHIAVQDYAGFSPFSLAVVRGHKELASTILEIAAVQYKPNEGEQYRFRLRGAEDDEEDYTDQESDADSDDPKILAQIIDEKFTIDDITALADTVKSKISPLTMLAWKAEFWRVADGKPQDKEYPPSTTILYSQQNFERYSWAYFHEMLQSARRAGQVSISRHAITTNDLHLLRFLLRTGMDLMARKAEGDDTMIYQLSGNDFEYAIKLGRTEIVGEIISKTGAGVPLQKMVQASGVVLKDKPRYYQGLSVYGKKRDDWAAERNAPRTDKAVENEHSPLLRSLAIGNMKSAEYFLSDAPLNRYKEFAEHFKDDKRVQSLAQSEGGIEKALTSWLATRSDLALHMCIIPSSTESGDTKLVEYILRIMPQTLEVKSRATGTTPLQLAFQLGKISVAKALIDAGANQAVRNHSGENILHAIMTNSNLTNAIILPKLFSMLEPTLIQSLLLERCSHHGPGSLTPLALYLETYNALDVIKIVLEHSQGKELDLLNGAGDYIIHTAVRKNWEQTVLFLVEYRPELLYYENATGMTPIEVAETQHLRSIVEHPPHLNSSREYKTETKPASDFAPRKEKSEMEKKIDDILDLEEDSGPYSSQGRMDRLLKKLAEKYPGKRRLVSVIEANEVAKRLAVEQQKRNEETRRRERLGLNAGRGYYHGSNDGYDRYGNRKSATDEVELWKGQSDARNDLAFWEIKIRKEKGEEVDEAEVWKKWEATRTPRVADFLPDY
jgi:ankyrin repeat protein